ncbi:MAG: UDP-N-acetylglucosamine 1-carboxyvinyltransferase [Rhodobacteraceae bacterium]|nr:UDP-N-acetylglucosamine 1-carboxyvinyltransferase [Paracoccaceae bacterium]MCY4196337.1 UDP-N-acetylglucosamine 1-carboxyvinyltransferase [Paracoccaceae bacterium]
MDAIVVKGGNVLRGSITIAGAKNSCLALMPAALLSDQPLTLSNAPRLSDIRTMARLLQTIGVEVQEMDDGRVLSMSAHQLTQVRADYEIVRKMRASILVLGPLLAREGNAVVSLPGGCAIGARPVDLHLHALEKLGAKIELSDGYVHATVNSSSLRGTTVSFPSRSVGATENIMLAAVLAKGGTKIENAACEPEITDLADCLRKMGARIAGDGTPTIEIEGTDSLNGATHITIPDRIETGTYMLAAAITGGELTLRNARVDLLPAFCEKLDAAGVQIDSGDGTINVRNRRERLKAVDVATQPYPGFPTDLQAQFMAAMSLAEGTSRLDERIFENRFMHAPELARMGADIQISGGSARVHGVKSLRGAPVMATDIRASVSLILAGLAAHGETTVSRVYHLDRGYERIEDKLAACGGDIRRIN